MIHKTQVFSWLQQVLTAYTLFVFVGKPNDWVSEWVNVYYYERNDCNNRIQNWIFDCIFDSLQRMKLDFGGGGGRRVVAIFFFFKSNMD